MLGLADGQRYDSERRIRRGTRRKNAAVGHEEVCYVVRALVMRF